MIVSINQPAYLPWLGYFQRIATSDLHVVLDHVQFEKNSFTNRNKVRTREGSCWLTVPVRTKGKFGSLFIDRLEIAQDTSWEEKHWATLKMNYARAPYFAEHAPFFEAIYSHRHSSLNPLMRQLTAYLLRVFGIRTPLLFSSEMPVEGAKDELVLNLCRSAGATTYLSGALGRNYLREELFHEAGIKVEYQEYNHPRYGQVFPGFEPFLSAVDLLFNCGPQSLQILLNDRESVVV